MKEKEKEGTSPKYNLRQYPNALKAQLVDQLVRADKSESQIAMELGIPSSTFYGYKKELLERLGFFRILNEMKNKDKSEQGLTELEKENDELKKALELSMLKVAGLETLIDVAEDQLNINIRKKSGVKQSK